MFLKDLVRRSALRGREAGEVAIGFTPHVVEVTDLVIPAGTADKIYIGDPFAIARDVRVLWAGFIQISPVADQNVNLLIDMESDAAGSSGVNNPPTVQAGQRWSWTVGEFNWSDFMWSLNQVPDDDGVVRVSVRAALASGSDITVIRARTAFLII